MENRQPRSPRGRLADSRYRAEMLARLDSLIAVLRVAQQKASDAQSARPGEAARLDKMHGDLSKSLYVCDTARRALNARSPQGFVPLEPSEDARLDSAMARPSRVDPRPGCFAESSNVEEFERLCGLKALPDSKLGTEELDILCALLAKSGGDSL
jgi:hypothetical protein